MKGVHKKGPQRVFQRSPSPISIDIKSYDVVDGTISDPPKTDRIDKILLFVNGQEQFPDYDFKLNSNGIIYWTSPDFSLETSDSVQIGIIVGL